LAQAVDKPSTSACKANAEGNTPRRRHSAGAMGCGNSKGATTPVRNASSSQPNSGAPHSSGKLLDKYTLGKVVGQGAFGVVYKCKKKGTQEEYAVKMIDQVETPLAEIKREAEMLHKLNHPTVIKLYDVYYEKVFVCMVMEFYKGGDMIQGMMAHWKSKGMIPIFNVKHLSKQMHTAVAWVHSKSCVHRDIKGDNFMMDFPNVENPQQRIYLSDFGTVREVAPGERMTQKCGTKNYWPPEFFKMNYGIKVDCWAVGVVMFGLVSGKFPFKGEEDVKFKKLIIPKRCPPEGQELIHSLLERDEVKRKECADALKHKFLTDFEPATNMTIERMDTDFAPDIKEVGANAGIQQRRAELVNRLQAAEGKGDKGKKPARNDGEKTFTCTDPVTERSTTFEWWSASKAADLVGAFAKANKQPPSDMTNREVTEETVKEQLRDHNVTIDGFGKGQAKRFEEFLHEIQNGSSRLMLDATKHKHVVREVDIVLVKISHSPGADAKYLVEVTEGLQEGQIAVGPALPGHLKQPVESTLQTAERLAKDMMGMGDCKIRWSTSTIEAFEESENSPAYPGIQTVYRKEVICGQVLTTNESVLQRLGLMGGGSKFQFQHGKKMRVFEWMTEARCQAKGIRLGANSQDQDFSALVYPPIGLEEEELNEFLKKNKVETGNWGTGTYKTLADFSEELVKGESTLIRQTNGRVARVVDIVVLELSRKDTGEVLVEASETFKENSQQLNRLPAVKRRSDEHQFHTARRMVQKYLRLDDNRVAIDPSDVRIMEEEQESKAYPGLATIYRKRFMKGVIVPEARSSSRLPGSSGK